jgi:hypothetical protein
LKWGDRSELGGVSFKRLMKYGIAPHDAFVDYGCGTLRMGVHAIRFLERGRYWGFDIDQALLDEGARLMGPEMENKAPNLRVISASSVREAAQANPALLVSLKVLIHVHPDELDEYFGNILTIIGTSGRAILTGKWSSGEPFQFARQSWAHSLERLKETVARKGGQLVVQGRGFPAQPTLLPRPRRGPWRCAPHAKGRAHRWAGDWLEARPSSLRCERSKPRSGRAPHHEADG